MGPNVEALLAKLQPASATLTKPPSVLDRFRADMGPSVVAPPPEVMGEAISTVGAPEALLKALQPLTRGGSLERGSELARELVGRLDDYKPFPERLSNLDANRMYQTMMKVEPTPVDLDKMAAMEKVTGTRPPFINALKAPEGFKFSGDPNKPGYTYLQHQKRAPQNEAVAKLYDMLDANVSKNPAQRFTPESRPKLLGRRDRSVVTQGQSLSAPYKNKIK